MATFKIEWTKLDGSIPLAYITSIIINNGILRKYASSLQVYTIDNIARCNGVPKIITEYQTDKEIKYTFSNVPQYNKNHHVDKNISTWELHSDDGSGHFIVRLYRDLGYVELEYVELEYVEL